MGDVIEILTTATNTVEVEAAGPQGIPGVGVPTGGSALQVLRKKTGTDYDTEWATGGGGASYDQSLNTTDSVTFESVTADKVAFDLTAAETAAQGELAWNADEETLDLGLAHGSVLQVGQETLYHVENSTASTITAGTLCVFSGTVGNSGKLRVAPHANNTNPTAIIGIATSTIAAGVGEEGYVTHFGKCRGINASGGAEAWANGDLLYASPTGGLTKTKPSAPIVTVAAVVSNNSSSGTLFVRPSFGQTSEDVGAQSSQAVEAIALSSSVTLTASRNKLWKISNNTASNYFVELPTTAISVGDIVEIEYESSTGRTLEIRRDGVAIGQSLSTITRSSYRADTNLANGWTPIALNYSNAGFLFFTQGDVLLGRQGTSGQAQEISCSAAGRAILDDADAAAQRTTLGLGTAATSATGDFAAASHAHGNINFSGQVGSTSGLPLKTGTAGVVEAGSFGTSAGTFAEGNDSRITSAIQSTLVDAKGDLIVATAADTVARLPVGATNGHVLTVDSAEAGGMKWAAASGGIGGSTGTQADNSVLRADGTGGSTAQASDLVIDDYTATTQGNITIAPRAVSFSATIAASDDFVTATGHTFSNGDQVTFTSLTGGAGLSANIRYFVRDATTNVFKVATTVSGAAVDVATNYTAATVERIVAVVINTRNVAPFIVGPKPDGTAVGGDARGLRAINIAMSRDNASEVARGDDSIAIGTRSDATTRGVAIGRLARATGSTSSTAIGQSTNASGQQGTAIGTEAGATALSATALGNSVVASAQDAVAIGSYDANDTSSIATAIRCVGLNAIANLRGMLATRPFNAVYWGGQTTSDTANVELNLDATATNRMTIAANTAVIADIYVIARRTDNTKFLAARRWVAIRRDGSNNTALIGAVQTIGTDQSEGSPTWTFTIDADDTASVESLRVRVTGAAAETVNWRVCAIYRVVA